MKLFISYKFTGVPTKDLNAQMSNLEGILHKQGIDTLCTYWLEPELKKKGMSVEDIYTHCLGLQEACDGVFSFLHYEEPSRGMELELEHAKKHEQPYILCCKQGLEKLDRIISYRSYASLIIIYTDMNDLLRQIDTIDIEKELGVDDTIDDAVDE